MQVCLHKAITAAAVTFAFATPNIAQGQTDSGHLATPIPYRFKNVQMVGGGFVDGIVFHPTARGVRYCRTDMGGAYRWDDGVKQWKPILDWVSLDDVNLMGVESIAVDPHDANRVYLACGTYSSQSNTAILRSNDGGKTFQRTSVPFRMGGNENGRGDGERLAVDPNDGRVMYFGSRQAGLWRTTDRAVTWQRVESFPDVTEAAPTSLPPISTAGGVAGQARRGFRPARGSGIVWVLFDPRSGANGKVSQTIYAGVSLIGRANLYRSANGGSSWQAVPGAPSQYRPNHGVLSSDGTLYISYGSSPGPQRMIDGGVWKLNTNTGTWTDITPEKPDSQQGRQFGYGAVSVDVRNPNALIASTFYHPNGEELFRSTDTGQSWRPLFHSGGGAYDYSIAPYVSRTPIHWLLDVEIDPLNSNHAMFTTGYGGYETFNLADADTGKPTNWSVMSKGIEETVTLELLSPPRGAHLLTAIGDYGGFVHWNLDKPALEDYYDTPRFGNTTSVACAANKPANIVRVGQAAGSSRGGNIGYSMDGGKTWQPTASVPQPGSSSGSVAVSSDGAAWIWTPTRSTAYVTRDKGVTWVPCTGLPSGTRVIADPVNAQTFYGMALFDGKLFTSTDAGATFTAKPLTLPGGLPRQGGDRFDSRGGQDKIYAAPGRVGDLWIAAFDGLYHTVDAGTTWAKLPGVQQINAFGFGAAAPGSASPALYLVGVIDEVRGVFRSTDYGDKWARINDDAHQWGLILQITGDPRIYGRVYVGTHGRGTVYGDPR